MQTAAPAIHCGWEAIKKIKPMLCFSWSIAISTHNPLSHAFQLFNVHAHARASSFSGMRYAHEHPHQECQWPTKWGGMEIDFFFFFLQTKSPNCTDMTTLDLEHYWSQSQEEPCNLQDLLVHGFFPYLLQWRYAATQSLTGVAVAFSGGLNRAEAMPCATSTDAFLFIHVNIRIHACPVVLLSSKHTHMHTLTMPPVVPSSHSTQQVWGGAG